MSTSATAIPVPAPTGSDLAALAAGRPPSAAYFAALAAPITPAYPLPDSAQKGVLGTVAGFTSNGIVIDVAPAISATPSASMPYVAGANAVAATTVTAVVTGATGDFVPGGYSALKVGSPIVVLGSGPASAFQAVAVVAPSPRVLGMASARNARARSAETPAVPRVTQTARTLTAERNRSSNVVSQTPFAITRTFGLPGIATPAFDVDTSSTITGCYAHADVQFQASAGLGETATYPMLLQDVSDPTMFAESMKQPMPVRIVNAPSTGAQTYVINYGISISGGIVYTLQNCGLLGGGTFPVSFGVTGAGGQGFSASTADPLPGVGETSAIPHASCPFVPIPVAGLINFLVNGPLSPSITLCYDFLLAGANVGANATITNADIFGAQNAMTDSSDTSTFSWNSTLPAGDPQVTLLPLASHPNGQDQPNILTLDSFTYQGNLTETVNPTIGIFGLAFPLPSFSVPVSTVFQIPSLLGIGPLPPIVGVSNPGSVQLTLHPHGGNIPVTGK